MPRENFAYEINTFGNVSVHRIEIEGYTDYQEEILKGVDPDSPNIYKGEIEDVLVIDKYIRIKLVAYGAAYSEYDVTIKNNDKSLPDQPSKFRVDGDGTSFPAKKLKWR